MNQNILRLCHSYIFAHIRRDVPANNSGIQFQNKNGLLSLFAIACTVVDRTKHQFLDRALNQKLYICGGLHVVNYFYSACENRACSLRSLKRYSPSWLLSVNSAMPYFRVTEISKGTQRRTPLYVIFVAFANNSLCTKPASGDTWTSNTVGGVLWPNLKFSVFQKYYVGVWPRVQNSYFDVGNCFFLGRHRHQDWSSQYRCGSFPCGRIDRQQFPFGSRTTSQPFIMFDYFMAYNNTDKTDHFEAMTC